MKKIFAALLLLSFCLTGSAQTEPMNRFIDDLMARMTVEEKIGQLNLSTAGGIVTGNAKNSRIAEKIREGRMGGLFNVKGAEVIRELQTLAVENSRLGIPLLFGLDVVHGYETIFPIPLGLSCSWDMEAIERSARIAAREASADGICWTFSPMVDISRDPRWGRVAEGSGEDPFLGSEIAKAMVRGYQGANMENEDEIMACVKHFALYGASEAGRDYNTVDMSRIRMYNEYFPPYLAAVEAGAGSVMASFNEVDGVPATANSWLLTEVLRSQWGFDGFVVSDFTGISEMVAHGTGDLQTVSAKALKAGTDMDMVSEGYLNTLARSIGEGKVSMKDLDRACRRILEAKYKLGLFENPYKYCDPSRRQRDIFTDENRREARRIAAETFVLLKNEGAVLPLKREGTIALIGPLADARTNMAGTWSLTAAHEKYATLKEGLGKALAGRARLLYAQGCNLMRDPACQHNATFGKTLPRGDEKELLENALSIASQSDVIVAALGEAAEMSGESSSRTRLELPETQRELLEALIRTGKPVVLLHFSGRPTVLTWENEHIPAILNVWFGGSEAADAIADVLFGDVSPSGKLTATFPRSEGQIPLFYNHKNTGRPLPEGRGFSKFTSCYLDESNEPLYPFGYGLSYTTFSYSDIRLSADEMDKEGNITASVTVSNTGGCDADEIVQLYIRDLVGSVSRPVRELKGFRRIRLDKGKSTEVRFEITPELLAFYDYELNKVCEPGEFEIMIGPDSRDLKRAKITLN